VAKKVVGLSCDREEGPATAAVLTLQAKAPHTITECDDFGDPLAMTYEASKTSVDKFDGSSLILHAAWIA
jgi:hypothetical protein